MFQTEYRRKLTTPEKAAELVPQGGTLIHGLTMAEPPALLAAVADRLHSGDLQHLKVHSLLPMKHVCDTVLSPDLADCVDSYTWFVSGDERGLVSVGLNYFVPNYFHQVPRLLKDTVDLDVCVTTVSPMDRFGYFSFGTANDFTSSAARQARRLMVEVNPRMPRVFGDALLHISEVDAVVENDEALLEMPSTEPTPEDLKIGEIIAGMVPDGACLQIGVGAAPNAVCASLANHKDLGIHTEVLGPGLVDLARRGAATGARKTLHRRKHVFTVAQGDQAMLDYMNDNPAMESYPVSYNNHPSTVAANDNLVSINAVLQVDLLGQANAEFLGGHQFSGTGGQLDFVRGAYESRGGKSILAFHSTAHDGSVSRILPRLPEGVMVTTPRMDTHWLVTEYGKANLKGASTRDRALAIIGLAHPDFRDELLRQAEDMYLL